MSSWNMGYQSQLEYLNYYFRMMSPVAINYVAISQGLDFPQINSDFKACELGFGQGLSLTIHAMSTPSCWVGNDFNPSQVNFAQNVANQTGLSQQKALLVDDSFEELLHREDLPQFDLICLHGIWSWISPANQQFILEFIRRKLKDGGFVYISYNVAPGNTFLKPVRNLLLNLEQGLNGSEIDPQKKLAKVFEVVNELVKVNPRYVYLVDGLKDRINKILKDDSHYIYAEFLNSDWDICYFDKMAQTMADIGLEFACQDMLFGLIDSLCLNDAQQHFLAPYKGTIFGELLKGFMVNQAFRVDLYHKSARKLTAEERDNKLNDLYVVLAKPLCELNLNVANHKGTTQIKPEYYGFIYQQLSDYKPHRIGDIKSALKDKLSASIIEECLMILMGVSKVEMALNPAEIGEQERQLCLAYNHNVLFDYFGDVEFLASPVIGGALQVSALNVRLLRVFSKHMDPSTTEVKPLNGAVDLNQIAGELLDEMIQNDMTRLIAAEHIKDPEQLHKEAFLVVTKFRKYTLPLFKSLGII